MNQNFYFESSSCLPTADLDMKEYRPASSRYDDQIAVFGASLHQRVTEQKYFLVGAGAIGCEMLKNWALVCRSSHSHKSQVAE
jgi:ubiquitin-activating enzyme E1